MAHTVWLGQHPLTIEAVAEVARDEAHVELTASAWDAVRQGRQVIEALANDDQPHYGISTGFGALATRHIPKESRTQLQRSLIRSHAAGSGPEVEREVVRALMLLRIATLASGHTGVREETLRAYLGLLNHGITPV
ncbi:MAG TPA: aromatic amino acid lyase, partial [Marmoricola sp.]|nr:aromatic amino acid lyase [Marmoricola sp.]